MKRLCVCAAVVIVLAGCTNPEAYYRTIRGYYSYHQGKYQEANVQYLVMRKKEFAPDIISYNLGNVYYVLGETDAAEEEWLNASLSSDTELLFRLYFNRGNMYYEKGEFELSYQYFRKALELYPDNLDAKHNLEMSLGRLNTADADPQQEEASSGDGELSDDVERVLQYIRRKEESEWISGNEDTASSRRDW
ncbi:MAG: tetratricopeptide repeat protein [Spirochaetales bacterium]|nr:tetratricopeptide repeat protein [Spirochaetales bacterium]